MTTPAPVVDLAPGTQVGEYQITGVLGRGGMGTVYQGVQPQIGKRVAIKVLGGIADSQEQTARFLREAQVVNRIGHPGIVDIFSFGQLPGGGRHFLIMEHLTGEPLTHRMQRGPFGWADFHDIFSQILAALAAAHSAGVVHRDLKPDNIFLVGGGPGHKVKLLDFGLAKDMEAGQDMTQTGIALGTPRYMAPEQSRGGRYVDHRADLYAVGLMMYEALTGRFPFFAPNPLLMLTLHLTEPPPPPSLLVTMPAALEQVILQALAKKPEERCETAGIMLAALQAVGPRDASIELRRLQGAPPAGAGSLAGAPAVAPRAVSITGALAAPGPPPAAPPAARGAFADEQTRIHDSGDKDRDKDRLRGAPKAAQGLRASWPGGYRAAPDMGDPRAAPAVFGDEETRLSPPRALKPSRPQDLRRARPWWLLPLCIAVAVLLGIVGGAVLSRHLSRAADPAAAPAAP